MRWTCFLALSGCVAWSQHVEGLAVWPVLFSAAADTEGMEIHARTSVIVAAVEVERDLGRVEQFPIRGAEAWVSGGGAMDLPLMELAPGLYALAEGPLAYVPGEPYQVDLVPDDREVFTAAPAASPLVTGHVELSHPIGERLNLSMPAGYAEEYDQVLVTVAGPDGEVTWSNQPDTATGWLDFVSGRSTPDPVEIPRRAFPVADQIYGVSVVGLVRARAGADRSPELRSEFSGFTTGSGKIVPVLVVP